MLDRLRGRIGEGAKWLMHGETDAGRERTRLEREAVLGQIAREAAERRTRRAADALSAAYPTYNAARALAEGLANAGKEDAARSVMVKAIFQTTAIIEIATAGGTATYDDLMGVLHEEATQERSLGMGKPEV